VYARSIEQVQAVMRIATATRTPVVPRGAGSGLAGGAIGAQGEIVLSTLRMNKVLEVSPDDELAVVQPGIINAELNRQLERYGLWYAPDPSSKELSTIGGNIATNAGGLLCAKYGVTRESVLGLKVVLADGRLLELGHRTVKGVTGYDLTALMIGSEGTLGVVVEATVKLRPIVDGPVVTLSAAFDSVEDAARASGRITAAHVRPAVMELIGDSAMVALDRHLGLGGDTGSRLIVQFDGPGAAEEAREAAAAILGEGGTVEFTDDPAEGERLFAMRRALHPAIVALGTVLIEDVSVPRSCLAEMFAEIRRIEREYGLTIPTVAHAGDGNLHPNFVFDGPEVPENVWAAADDVFRTALSLGGTLTGEHGVGILKRRWLRDELGDDQIELQRQVKAVFDPLGILNPGKVY
jgi:glycolate oxidase